MFIPTPAPQHQFPVDPDQVGKTSRILVGALMMGMIFFGITAVVIVKDRQPEPGIVAYIAAGFAGLMVVTSLVLSSTSTSQAIRQIASEKPENWRQALASVYTTKQIVANAPLEGAGFFNLISYITDNHWISLTIVGVLLSLMAITFPSQSQFESWAEQVQREHS